MNIKGKNIFITGSAKRFGRILAVFLAEKGANIAIHYNRSKKDAVDLQKELTNIGVKSVLVRADLKKPKEISKAVNDASKKLRGLHVLINNAAIFYKTPLEKITDKEWNDFLDVNLKGQFYFARAFSKVCIEKPSKIINMSDVYSISPSADFIPYGTSKAAVVAMTKGLAKALSPDILVNSISPAPFLPPKKGDKKAQRRAEKSRASRISPKDVINKIVYLIENDSITGKNIEVAEE